MVRKILFSILAFAVFALGMVTITAASEGTEAFAKSQTFESVCDRSENITASEHIVDINKMFVTEAPTRAVSESAKQTNAIKQETRAWVYASVGKTILNKKLATFEHVEELAGYASTIYKPNIEGTEYRGFANTRAREQV